MKKILALILAAALLIPAALLDSERRRNLAVASAA